MLEALESVMTDRIYYLTGRGGQLNEGLGEALLAKGYKLSGREMTGTFAQLPFQNQLDLITKDLQDSFWHKDAKVVAVSYGAYLLLHALAELAPYVGSILLLSPVLGGVTNGSTMRYFSPPRADKLMRLVEEGNFPVPNDIEIHVGGSDWQSPYQRAEQFAEAVGGECQVVSGAAHQLGEDYVSPVLDNWCRQF